MDNKRELNITLNVQVTTDGVEHELTTSTDGYTADQTRDIQDIVNQDVDYFLEDIRRRVLIIK